MMEAPSGRILKAKGVIMTRSSSEFDVELMDGEASHGSRGRSCPVYATAKAATLTQASSNWRNIMTDTIMQHNSQGSDLRLGRLCTQEIAGSMGA